MIESFYAFLETIGMTHPIHPIVVHAPMGLIIGAVAFSLAEFKWPDKHLGQSAYHCMFLALISVVPVYIAGLLDWQHVFAGEFNKWIIIKLILGVVLTVLLAYGVIQKNNGASQQKMLVIYFLLLGVCGGLGFSGGELLYGG